MDPEELELVKTEYEDLRIRYHKQTRRLKVSLRVVFTSCCFYINTATFCEYIASRNSGKIYLQ